MNASTCRSLVTSVSILLSCLGSACGGGGGGGGSSVALAYVPAVSGYVVGFPLELAPDAGGSPTAFVLVAGALPAGVSFNTSTGTFGGRPLVAGSSDLTVRASDGSASVDFAFTLHVVPPPAARFLYVAESADDLLAAFVVDAESGAARHVGAIPTGDEPRNVAVAPGSTHVAVGTKFDGLWLYAIDALHGRPKPVSGTPLVLGSEVRDLVFHPDGTHLYALAVSGDADDLLFQLEFDAATGALVPLSPPAVSVPNGSTALAADPLGRALYLTHGAAVRSFAIGPDGSLSMAGDRAGGAIPVDVAAAPDGSAVYALNFLSKDLWRFPISAGGALKVGSKSADLVANVPVTLAITGDGGFLYVGDGAGMVEQFRRKPSGALEALNPPSVALNGDLRGLAADPSGAGAWVTLGSRREMASLSAGALGALSPDLDTPVRTHGLPMGIAAAPGTSPAVVRTTSLYAVNRDDDDFNQFAVAPDGTLNALVPAVVPSGAGPQNVVAHPFRDALYVSNSGDTSQAVGSFKLNTNGVASTLQPFAALKGSQAVLIGLNGDLAHVVLEDELLPVSISAGGLLSSSGPASAALSTGRAVAHPGGTGLYLPNGLAGGVLSFAVALDDGALTLTGGAPADAGTNALAAEPTGRFLYAVNDSAGVDRVRGWTIDAVAGTLSELATSPFALPDLAADAIAIAAHPLGRLLYVATRDNAAVAGQGAIHVFEIETDPTSGAALGGLTPLGQPTLLAGQQPYDLAVTPDGATLYVSIETPAGRVLAYALNAAGALSINPVDSELTGSGTRGLGLRTRIE